MLKIISISLPPIMTNCYIIYEKDGGKCFIIDPASSAEKIQTLVEAHSLTPKAILLTHGHFDHIGAAEHLRKFYSIPLYIHSGDAEMLLSPSLNCSKPMLGTETVLSPADRFIKDGDNLKLESKCLKVMHTPGHSPGSCVLIGNGFVISGDTIFRGTYGRYDLPGGDFGLLMQSIKKILELNPIYSIYPGHDEKTTVADELMCY